jgi:TetR/AcrR family transcriptional regulator, mexJK operon transcriptional repressor
MTESPLDERRSARKRRAILTAASEVFLSNGYLGTSMDEIAARAAVSKQTVYKHFADKENLFTSIMLGSVDQAQERIAGITLDEDADLRAGLANLARQLIRVVIRPEMMRLRRIIIGEAERFPKVARTWYQQGPGRVVDSLATRFAGLAERGLLRVEDPRLAAAHFNWLVLSIPLNEIMFRGNDEAFPDEELDRIADEGARVFLAAYGI